MVDTKDLKSFSSRSTGSSPVRGTIPNPTTNAKRYPRSFFPAMLKIRLSRVGRKHVPLYRIVVTEHTQAAKHGYLDVLGHYNPITKEFVFDREAADKYVKNGAQYSDTVKKLIAR